MSDGVRGIVPFLSEEEAALSVHYARYFKGTPMQNKIAFIFRNYGRTQDIPIYVESVSGELFNATAHGRPMAPMQAVIHSPATLDNLRLAQAVVA